MIRAWLIIVQIPADERQTIVDSFKDRSNIKKVVAEGVHINGEKYVTLDSTDDSLKAKKVGNQIVHRVGLFTSPYFDRIHILMYIFIQGKEGIVVIKTTQALLIGHHPAEVQTTVAYSSVAELAEYLIKVGY